MANILSKDKQIAIIGALAEGSSIRSIERITGVHRDTIMRLGVRVGRGMRYACSTPRCATYPAAICNSMNYGDSSAKRTKRPQGWRPATWRRLDVLRD